MPWLAGGGEPSTQIGTFADRPNAGVSGRVYFATDSPIEQWIDDGAEWRPVLRGRIGKAPPSVAEWSQINASGLSIADNNGAIFAYCATPGASFSFRMIVRSAPSGYVRTACFRPAVLFRDPTYSSGISGDSPGNSGDSNAGIVVRESSSGKFIYFGMQWNAGGGSPKLYLTVEKANSPTSYNSPYIALSNIDLQSEIWMRVDESGANRVFSFSRDGQNFLPVQSAAKTDFISADQVGMFVDATNIRGGFTLVSWE